MSHTLGIKSPSLARHIAAMLLSSAILTSLTHAQNNEAILLTATNIPYVSGGIGIASIDRLDTMSNQFNVKLVFALKTGEYVSDVKVTIADAGGKPVVQAVSDGPWFLTKLPAGRYQVMAVFAGNTEQRTVVVGGARLNTIDFRWASE